MQSVLFGQCRGRVTSIATGQGAVRRMHFAPPTCTQLDHVAGSLMSPNLNARVCCLFVNGTFGVWELDSRNELRAVSLYRVETCHNEKCSKWACCCMCASQDQVLAGCLEMNSGVSRPCHVASSA